MTHLYQEVHLRDERNNCTPDTDEAPPSTTRIRQVRSSQVRAARLSRPKSNGITMQYCTRTHIGSQKADTSNIFSAWMAYSKSKWNWLCFITNNEQYHLSRACILAIHPRSVVKNDYILLRAKENPRILRKHDKPNRRKAIPRSVTIQSCVKQETNAFENRGPIVSPTGQQ